MTLLDTNPALIIGLQAAVPMWIHQLSRHDTTTRDAIRVRWAADAADAVAYQGDALQYGGKRGEAAKVFNHLARGLAAAAFNPGGITALDEHWCVDHAACVDADRQAAAAPSLLDTEPDTDEPAAPTYRGRPVVDLPLPEVL